VVGKEEMLFLYFITSKKVKIYKYIKYLTFFLFHRVANTVVKGEMLFLCFIRLTYGSFYFKV